MKSTPRQRPPFLIQRCRLKSAEDRVGKASKGLDGAFTWDYMGAAEFEYGALSKALADMRAVDDLAIRTVLFGDPLDGSVCKAWFIGDPSHLLDASALFVDQLTGRESRLKESTAIACAYGRCERETTRGWKHRSDCADRKRPFDGWWCVDPGAAWAILRTREAADAWYLAVRGRHPPDPKVAKNKR